MGLVVGVQGSKAQVIPGWKAQSPQHVRSQTLPLRSIDPICPLPSGASVPERPGVFPWSFSAQELVAASPSRRDAGAAWLLLLDEQEGLPLVDWAALVHGDPQPVHLAAAWLWLQGGQQLFRWRQQRVSARPATELRNLRHDLRRSRLAHQAQEQWHGLLRQRQPIDPEQLAPGQRAELELLHQWASGDTTAPLPPELRKALQGAQCPADTGSIRHLLVDLGQWEAHHLPSLQASPWQLGFSPELEALADQLVASHDDPRPGDGQRLDLTHFPVVTIDDADTQDIDDGLSLELRDDGILRLWIHVADPGRLVSPGDPLDLEARRRASSLYLSRGTLPMFPLALATGPFSLRAGRRCAAWSVWVELAADGAIAASGLQRSWVKPLYRLSYDDADELIELAPPEERQLEQIHGLMALRRRWRVSQGALLLDQAEGRIRERDGEPCLEITDPSPGRLMVAEAMILAGAVVAEFGRSHGLPLPYRSQLPAELPPAAELEQLADGPVRHAAIKRCLSRGLTGTSPSAHFSLGLPAYVQATSPIRRYADLVVQRQLDAQLQGETGLDAPALQELLAELEGPLRQGIQISREDQRHWQQVWFEQHKAEQWRAQFLRWLRPQDRLGLVHVDELAMDLAAECPSGAEPGDQLLLRVQLVDPLRDQLRLRASA